MVDNIPYRGKSYCVNHDLLEEDHCVDENKLQVTQALKDEINDKKLKIGKQKKCIKRDDATKELVTSNDTTRHLETCLNLWNSCDDVAVTNFNG